MKLILPLFMIILMGFSVSAFDESDCECEGISLPLISARGQSGTYNCIWDDEKGHAEQIGLKVWSYTYKEGEAEAALARDVAAMKKEVAKLEDLSYMVVPKKEFSAYSLYVIQGRILSKDISKDNDEDKFEYKGDYRYTYKRHTVAISAREFDKMDSFAKDFGAIASCANNAIDNEQKVEDVEEAKTTEKTDEKDDTRKPGFIRRFFTSIYAFFQKMYYPGHIHKAITEAGAWDCDKKDIDCIAQAAIDSKQPLACHIFKDPGYTAECYAKYAWNQKDVKICEGLDHAWSCERSYYRNVKNIIDCNDDSFCIRTLAVKRKDIGLCENDLCVTCVVAATGDTGDCVVIRSEKLRADCERDAVKACSVTEIMGPKGDTGMSAAAGGRG